MPSGQKRAPEHKRTHPARFSGKTLSDMLPSCGDTSTRPQYAPRACDVRAHGELFRHHSNYQRFQTLPSASTNASPTRQRDKRQSSSASSSGTPSSSAPSMISTTVRFAEDESTRTADDGKIPKRQIIGLHRLTAMEKMQGNAIASGPQPPEFQSSSHDLSRCTAFPLLYLVVYYCMLYHNRAKYTRGKFVCERCGSRAIGHRGKLRTRTNGGPLRPGSKHTRASGSPCHLGSKHFNQ